MTLSPEWRDLVERAESGRPVSVLELGALDALAKGVLGAPDANEQWRAGEAVAAVRKKRSTGEGGRS